VTLPACCPRRDAPDRQGRGDKVGGKGSQSSGEKEHASSSSVNCSVASLGWGKSAGRLKSLLNLGKKSCWKGLGGSASGRLILVTPLQGVKLISSCQEKKEVRSKRGRRDQEKECRKKEIVWCVGWDSSTGGRSAVIGPPPRARKGGGSLAQEGKRRNGGGITPRLVLTASHARKEGPTCPDRKQRLIGNGRPKGEREGSGPLRNGPNLLGGRASQRSGSGVASNPKEMRRKENVPGEAPG